MKYVKEGPVLLIMCVLFLIMQIKGYMFIDVIVDDAMVKVDYKLLWTVIMFVAYPTACYYIFRWLFAERQQRAFTLKGVTLYHSSGLGRSKETFIFEPMSWLIPVGETSFFVDLEDTDQVYNVIGGWETESTPKFMNSIKLAEQFSEQDRIKVTIQSDGTLAVRYLGPSNVIAHIDWELSEPFTDVPNSVRNPSEEDRPK